MATGGDDADLDALRSAVLASLKTRGKSDNSSSCVTTEDEGSQSQYDVELEELRKAALRSKRLLDNEKALQLSFRQAGFPSIGLPGFKQEVGCRKGFNRNANLIVIEPVELCAVSSESLPNNRSQSPKVNSESNLQSQQPQKSKSSGKFSRFDSDSDSESSEDDAQYSNEKSLSSNLTDEDDDDSNSNQSNNGENGDETSREASEEENVLLLHPDEDLHEIESAVLKNSNESTSEKAKPTSPDAGESVGSEVKKRTRREVIVFDSHPSPRSSEGQRSKERSSRLATSGRLPRSVKENNNDERNNRNRFERFRESDERRRKEDFKFGNDNERNDRHKSRRRDRDAGKETTICQRSMDDQKNERRSKSVRMKDDRQNASMSSIVVPRRGEESKEKKFTTTTSVKDNGCKTVLRDLREKLRQKQQTKKPDVDVNDEEADRRDRSSPIVKSVLNVVASTAKSSSADESKSESRSPLANSSSSRDRHVRSPRGVGRKSESPGRVKISSPKARKVLIVSEEAKTSVSKLSNKRSRLNDATMEEEEDGTPIVVQRIPVRQRLGVAPKKPTKSSSSSFTSSSRRSKSASVRNSMSPTMSSRVKPAAIGNNEPTESSIKGVVGSSKRKLKVSAGDLTSLVAASTSHPSTSNVNKLKPESSSSSNDKSRRRKGLPTFENELDEKIRRIQANNEAILKRKYEIAWDRHRHD